MTRGAGQGALTRPEPVNVDVIVDGDIKEVVPLLGLKRIKLVFFNIIPRNSQFSHLDGMFLSTFQIISHSIKGFVE